MKEIIGKATLYLGDCAEILPTLERVDAVITDPPYGIDVAKRGTLGSDRVAKVKDYGSMSWDENPASKEILDMSISLSIYQAIFGGNYFNLPPSSCWLVWDKMNTGDYADCELAWTNWPKAVRRIQWLWNGMIRKGNEERFHPTQKPLGVMKWVIDLCPKSDSILDPFMGSGTTGVAAVEMGKTFIGIEREESYFQIACDRIYKAQQQEQLFGYDFPTELPQLKQQGLGI